MLGFFDARGVRALVVGAHAVAFHAKPRFTKDLDLLVEPTKENGRRIVQALDDFGFGSVGLEAKDFAEPGMIIQLGIAPNRIDLLTSIERVTFARAWAGRVLGRFGSREVFYLGREELIRAKEAAGRPQDEIDLQWLRDSGS